MSYIEVAKGIYEMLQGTDFRNLLKGRGNNYDEFRTLMWDKFRINELISSYKQGTSSLLEKHLSFYNDVLNKFLKSEEIAYYENHMPLRTAFYLFWIWDKKLEIADEKLDKFIESFYIGTFGYKMIDVFSDNKNPNAEMIFVGFYAIKIAEKLLSEALGTENTSTPILKYFKIYADVECFEKKNRWKVTPFKWDEPERLGNKAAPIYMVYETLFRFANYDEQKISDLMKAFNYTAAALQIVDDLLDAKEDLSNGYETLVMTGYYEIYGFQDEITDEKITAILDQERLKTIYTIVHELFDKARALFEKHDEYIILLTHEIQFYNINSLIEAQ
ncbi:MAG: hypothetical protein A2006_03785 [Ignavibacteria bacterium GWC2_35_8]|nr:MAG: hypothetical protein A2006_03785 [Ignavibacteria bacterium GWC2_35_8]